jgi:hypothetical protein
MTWFDQTVTFLGGVGGLLGVVGYLGSRLVEHRLGKDKKSFDATFDERLAKETKIFEQKLADERNTFDKTLDAKFAKDMKTFDAMLDAKLANDMKTLEAKLAAAVRIKELQLEGYREIWELSGAFRPSDTVDYPSSTMQDAGAKLRDWYYAKGHGILLSFCAQELFQPVLTLLSNGRPEDSAAVRNLFSWLRTQLKKDLGFYTDSEAARSLPSETMIARARLGEHPFAGH